MNKLTWRKYYPFLSIGLSLLISLLLLEVVLRILNLGYDDAGFQYSSEVHHEHKKDFTFVIDNPAVEEGNGLNIRYDQHGFIPSGKEIRDNDTIILFCGDSYTEALQVPAEKNFVSIIQSKLPNKKVANAGVGSYSPLLMRLDYQRKKKQFHIEKVIIQLYANDVAEDSLFAGKLVSNGGQYTFEENELARLEWYRKSYAVRYLRKTYIRFHFAYFADHSAFIMDKNYAEHQKSLLETLTEEIMLDWLKELASDGVEVFVMTIPSRSIHLNHLEGESLMYQSSEELMSRVPNANWIPLKPLFDEHAVKEDFLFFDNDIHLNEKGHQAVASMVLNAIALEKE